MKTNNIIKNKRSNINSINNSEIISSISDISDSDITSDGDVTSETILDTTSDTSQSSSYDETTLDSQSSSPNVDLNYVDVNYVDLKNGKVLELIDLPKNTIENEEIEQQIYLEKKQEMSLLEQDLSNLSEIWVHLAELLHDQGENIVRMQEQITHVEENTQKSVEYLGSAADYIKDKFVIARDISIVVAGGIIGATGLLFGPIIGTGTIVTGVTLGGATVAGIRRNEILKK